MAQQAFEGVVTMKLVGTGISKPRIMKYFVKNGVLRLEMEGLEGAKGYSITDPRRQLNYVVMPAQKVYMEMKVASDVAERVATSEPRITKTGKVERIAGHECEHWLIKVDKEESDVCVAKGLGRFFVSADPMGRGGEPAWLKKLGGDFFPLRYSRAGQAGASIEVTHIEKRTLDKSLFEPPPGYRKMTMPDGKASRKP